MEFLIVLSPQNSPGVPKIERCDASDFTHAEIHRQLQNGYQQTNSQLEHHDSSYHCLVLKR